MDKFRDYIWYLLSKPFKILKKAQNQWWIWAKVMGGWWDEVKDDLQRARDETTIATCSDIMLQIHAEDRGPDGITQYVGESNDAFRSRIAMYDETERLGGTRDGIILAVNSIGYEDVEHVWLPRYNGDWDRWAEFIIIINEDVANPQPTSTANLIREVRDKKESTSKDNYLIWYYADVWNKLICEMDTTYLLRSHFYKQRYLDGSGKLDGSRTLCGAVGRIELLPDYLFQTETQVSFLIQTFTEYTALVEHKTVQDQEYEVLMNTRYLRNTDVLISLASDFLFRARETWKWRPEARSEYHMAVRQEQDIASIYGIRMTTIFFPARHLDGSRKLDGSRTLSGAIGRIEGDTGYLLDTQNKIIKTTEQELENVMDVQTNVLPEVSSAARMTAKFWYGRRLDGTRKLDGSRTLSTLTGRIEARKDYLFDVYTVAQGSGSIG